MTADKIFIITFLSSIPLIASCEYCLGPENTAGNAAVRPYRCNGNVSTTFTGLLWNAHEDGLEYAINDHVSPIDNPSLNNLIDAHYIKPDFKWDVGFKLGVGIDTTYDGWDVAALWTRFYTRAHDEVEEESAHSLLPLWSAYQFPNSAAPILNANRIQSIWKLDLDIVDLALGREFWLSKFVTLRPHAGLRLAWIGQELDLRQRGGSWEATGISPALNNFVELKNAFKGTGICAGIDSNWHLGSGWSLFGNAALALIYGHFRIKHTEYNRLAAFPFSKIPVLETKAAFGQTTAAADLALGVEWSTLYDKCQSLATVSLAWEHHVFFDQNQLFRVVRNGSSGNTFPNNSGENVITQTQGDLSLQGWTLSVRFDY